MRDGVRTDLHLSFAELPHLAPCERAVVVRWTVRHAHAELRGQFAKDLLPARGSQLETSAPDDAPGAAALAWIRQIECPTAAVRRALPCRRGGHRQNILDHVGPQPRAAVNEICRHE